MASPALSDKQVIDALGVSALTEAGFTEWQVKQWRQRGIAWPERAAVQEIAAGKRINLPSDFLKKRRITAQTKRAPKPKKRAA